MKLNTLPEVGAALAVMRTERILQQSLTAEMNAAIAAVKCRFEPKIQAAKDRELAEALEVQAFLDAQRKTLLPGKSKSLQVEGHTLGYRSNGGAVSFTRKAGGAAGVLAAIVAAGGKLKELFVRQKEELDKAAIKARWDAYGEELTAFGVKLKEEELFFIELDMDGAPKA